MNEHALTLLKIAIELAPQLAKIIRDGVISNPDDATSERVASILPEQSASQIVAETLRSAK